MGKTKKEVPVTVGYINFLLTKEGARDALLAILPHLSSREIIKYRTDFENLGVDSDRILLEMDEGQFSAEVIKCFLQDGMDADWLVICMSPVNRVRYYNLLTRNGAKIDLTEEAKALTFEQAQYCRAVLAEHGYSFKKKRDGGIKLERSR